MKYSGFPPTVQLKVNRIKYEQKTLVTGTKNSHIELPQNNWKPSRPASADGAQAFSSLITCMIFVDICFTADTPEPSTREQEAQDALARVCWVSQDFPRWLWSSTATVYRV